MLATIEKAKSLLGIPAEDGSADGPLALYLAAATTVIEEYCRRSFCLQEYRDRKYDGTSRKYLLLEGYPIIQVSNVQLDGTGISDYEIVSEKGMLFRKGGWCAGDQQITLSYTAGYVLPGSASSENPQTLPESLELACVLLCQTLMRTPGVTSERVGDLAVTYANDGDGLPSAVKSLVNPYRRWG